MKFSGAAELEFGFGTYKLRADVLHGIERIGGSNGRTSLVAGTDAALAEIARRRRPKARLVIVIVSDGASQDIWQLVVVCTDCIHFIISCIPN